MWENHRLLPDDPAPLRVNKKILIDLIGLELIALVVVVGYKLSPMLLPRADLVVEPDPACNLQREDCAVRLPDGGTVELSVGTRPIPLVKSFPLEVRTRGLAAERVEVDFSGVDMEMGFNRPQLAARGDGRFAGDATLPVCVTGRMVWQATVLVDSGATRIAVPYRFTSGEAQ